jgi:hypothetical protein
MLSKEPPSFSSPTFTQDIHANKCRLCIARKLAKHKRHKSKSATFLQDVCYSFIGHLLCFYKNTISIEPP